MHNFKSVLLIVAFSLLSSSLLFAQESKRNIDQNVFILVEASIKHGLYDGFVEVAQYMSDVVYKEEPTALTYQWTVNADHTTCRILERYTNSETTLAHAVLFGEKFAAKFSEVAEVTNIQVYGNPSEELLKALGVDESGYFSPMAGFSR